MSRLAAGAVQANAIAKLARRGNFLAYQIKGRKIERLLQMREARLGDSDKTTPGFRTVYIPGSNGKYRRLHHKEAA